MEWWTILLGAVLYLGIGYLGMFMVAKNYGKYKNALADRFVNVAACDYEEALTIYRLKSRAGTYALFAACLITWPITTLLGEVRLLRLFTREWKWNVDIEGLKREFKLREHIEKMHELGK